MVVPRREHTMNRDDSHGIPLESLGDLIGKSGQLNDPPTADSWGDDPGLSRTIEGEIIPRLMMLFDQHISGSLPTSGRRTGALMPDDVREFVNVVLENDADVICEYVSNLRDSGESLPDLYLSLLAPAARELGEMWNRDDCSFTAVTLGVSRLHQVLMRFSPCFSANQPEDQDAGHRALIIPVPGEDHTFGLFMLAEFFRREGWNICSATPGTTEELVGLVKSGAFDVVGCSLSTEQHMETLVSMIEAVRGHSRNQDIKIIVGGRIFSEQPELVDTVGADATASNGLDAVRLAEQLVSQTQ